MKKGLNLVLIILGILSILLIAPAALAVELSVEQLNDNQAMILGLSDPAVFNLKITNHGATDNFRFYNLYGFTMEPGGYVEIKSGETKNISLQVFPIADSKYRGYYNLKYGIRSQRDETEYLGELNIKIVDLKDALEIGGEAINPESQTMTIYLKNRENFNFPNMKIDFVSPFFEKQDSFSLAPKEKKTWTIQLDKENFKSLLAGYYTLTAKVETGGKKETVEGIINFQEKDIVTSVQKDEGFIINTKVIRKSNQGNVVATTQTIIKKNIISRLFTTISPQPDVVERQGFEVFYTWNRQLQPGENLDIEVKTNWLFPFIAILFVLAIIGLAFAYTKTHVSINKQVSFVRAKGGEFALRVSLIVRAKNYVEKVSLIDKLPPLTKVYEKFGGEQPLRVNAQTGRIEWIFDKLNKGETRIVNYIIYSKVGVLGKFVLPKATAIYERDGEIKETESNKAFFVAEQSTRRED